jgi:hypothetical protein
MVQAAGVRPTPSTTEPGAATTSTEGGGTFGGGIIGFRRWTAAERWALVVLVVLPVLIFVVPALFGHLVDPGDDATQNYPLRILVGQQLRHGHLPVFDPYIWSGAPLLAGWNAGAAYPLTWLFVVLPGAAAWTLGLVVTWWFAGLGLLFFLRASRLGVLSSALGAVTFTFAGAMTAQITHFGLVAGASWIPLQLLALLRLTEGGRSRASMSMWCAVLAATVGMTLLAGEPRAVDVCAAALVPYVIWRLVRLGRGAPGPALAVLSGLVVGAGLGAVQLLPGLAAVSTSQRAGAAAQLYSSGSLPIKWLLLLVVPDLFGGSGSFGQPSFFGTYSLTEVTAYVGLLPLAGALALLGQLRRRRPLPDWPVWHVVAVLGVLLALGTHTPAWHLFEAVPLSGAERLPSRDLMVLDLALAVLFAYWVEGWLGSGQSRRVQAEGRSDGVRPRKGFDASTALGTMPALAAMATVVVALVWGAGLLVWLGLTRSAASNDGGLKPWLVPWLVLGVLVVVLLVAGPRFELRRRTRLLVALFSVDLVAFTVLTVLAVVPGPVSDTVTSNTVTSNTVTSNTVTSNSLQATGSGAPSPGSSGDGSVVPLADLGITGRFAVYDPGLLNASQLNVLGVPDGNAVSSVPSVQGYGSIEDATYASDTGTHLVSGGGQNDLAPAALANGTFDQLELGVLATPSPYLITPPAGQPGRGSVQPGPPGTGQRLVRAGGTTAWYLGVPLQVQSVTVSVFAAPPGPPGAAASGVRLGLETAAGQVQWLDSLPTSKDAGLRAEAGGGTAAVALVARAGARPIALGVPTLALRPGIPGVSTSPTGAPENATVLADGQLTDGLLPPRWQYFGTDGSFALYRDTYAGPALGVQGLHGGPAPGASVRGLGGPVFAPTSAAVWSPAGVVVIRSEADIPGWTASWRPGGRGRARPVAVRRQGLVQALTVPAGSGILSWSYRAPGLWPGVAVSAVALAVLVGLLVPVFRRRRPG